MENKFYLVTIHILKEVLFLMFTTTDPAFAPAGGIWWEVREGFLIDCYKNMQIFSSFFSLKLDF